MRLSVKKPYLALGITSRCNYNCPYCNPIGENYGTSGKELPTKEWLKFIDAAYNAGIGVFRITGGEPLIREDILKILKRLEKYGVKINLCTNGELLNRFVNKFTKMKNLHIRVSIDTVEQFKNYPKFISKKKTFAMIKLRENGIPVRINMVVTKSNKNEVWKLLLLCIKYKFNLKLLDLYWDFPGSENYWYKEFVNLNEFISMLSNLADKTTIFNEDGGYGIPMHAFNINGIHVIVKDSIKGTHYHPLCRKCSLFPCQEGIYTPFISSDGTLHPSHCLFEPFVTKVAYKDVEEIERAIKNLLLKLSNVKKSNKLPSYLVKVKK